MASLTPPSRRSAASCGSCASTWGVGKRLQGSLLKAKQTDFDRQAGSWLCFRLVQCCEKSITVD